MKRQNGQNESVSVTSKKTCHIKLLLLSVGSDKEFWGWAVEIAPPLFGAEVIPASTYPSSYSGVGSKVIIGNNWFLLPQQLCLNSVLNTGP